MKIKVHVLDGRKLSVKVKSDDAIGDVKNQIKKQTGEAVTCDLIYKNTLLLADLTVSECGLYDGCRVLWRERWWITVVTEYGKDIPLAVWSDASVEVVKRMVKNEEKIDVANQLLKFKDKELPNAATMEEYGIMGVALHLKIRESLPHHTSKKGNVAKTEPHHNQCVPAKATGTIENPPGSTAQFQEPLQASAVESTMRQNHQEIIQRCRELSENDQLLAKKVEELEYRLVRQNVAALQREPLPRSTKSTSIQQNFEKNFNAFFDIELDVADHLLQSAVLTRDKYDYIFDRSTPVSRRDRVREMLREVMKSESNIRAFHQALLEQGDARSKELAALLE